MKRSYLIAAATLLAITLWMLSGMLGPLSDDADEASQTAQEEPLTRVEVELREAESVAREVVVQGQSQAKHELVVKAQLSAEISELLVEQGQRVERGQTLLRLAEEERAQELAQARALVAQRELEYQAAQSLREKGLQAARQLAEAETLLHTARVTLKRAELGMARLRVRAPFTGWIQARHVAPGEAVQVASPLLTLMALDPLVLRGDVAEGEVGRLRPGMRARAELSDGQQLEGVITYIAPQAHSDTRTFAVEMEAANPEGRHRGGMSATLHIPLESVEAHQLSPALLSLTDDGVLGVKTVDEAGVVQFHPVEILKSGRDGLWVAGLPEQLRLITVGQGFVRAGDRVEAVEAKAKPNGTTP
ncbi:MAG: efflux RND transporter periplasmic adaptor subunit [Pseudomonadota bacterium]